MKTLPSDWAIIQPQVHAFQQQSQHQITSGSEEVQLQDHTQSFQTTGKLQKTGAQHTQYSMGGDTDLKFAAASGLFKNLQLQYKHTLLKKKNEENSS